MRRVLLTGRAAYRWVTHPRDSRDASRCSARVLVDHQLDQADRASGVVVDVDVLDVDLAGARVGEQPGELAGVVGHGDEHRAGRADRSAVLAGDRPGAGDALPRGAPRRRRGPRRRRRRSAASSWSRTSRAGRGPLGVGRPRSGRRAPGRRPATRVTSRTPWPGQRQVLGGASASRPATSDGEQVRHVRGPGHRPVVLLGRQAHRYGAAQRATSCSTSATASRPRRARAGSPPRAGRRRAPRSRPAGPERSLPAIGWPPT